MNLVPQQVGLPEPIILQSDFFFKFHNKKKKENCSVVTSCNMQVNDIVDLAPWVGAWGRGEPQVNHTAKSRGDCSSER